ncbi:MAG TPA: AMP-binding protein [Frankiaceae bacterium]|nr:AMP-binding protein [Frankiaceae bacterium]
MLDNVVTRDEQAERYREQGLWTAETLSSRVADLAGPATAVIEQLGKRAKTYAELAGDAAGLAMHLSTHGVSRGDVVSIQLPNCYEAVVAAVATNSLGAVLNPLLPNYRARELSHVFSTAAPKAVFIPATYRGFDHQALLDEVTAKTGVAPLRIVVDVDDPQPMAPASNAGLRPGASASDVSELIFTSGTEATPKAIMHTEETANFAVRATFAELGLSAKTVVWMPSPVGHSTGFNYGIRAALVHGATLVLQDRWDAADAARLIAEHQCNYTLAATTFLDDLVGHCEKHGIELPSLTHFGCGGAPVPGPLVARAERLGICVLRLYGSTEVLCATWNRPDSPPDKRANTDGCALRHTEIEVRGEDGKTLTAPAEGELHIKGPNTSVGLAYDPERTAATYLDGGWVRSGDLVRLDADGYLTVVGRKKEIIIRGGVNIAPREIEDMLSEFPEVRQVAVVALPDERLGERGCACVVPHPDCTLDFDTMVARLREAGLATYKLPERLVLLDALPTTASGKVQKHQILRRIQGDSAR